jgi:hypothetical protein
MNREQLTAAQKRTKLATGTTMFFRRYPALHPCDANANLIESEILLRNLTLDDPNSWELASSGLLSKLAPRPLETPASVPEPEPWRYPFPEIHTTQDIRELDSKLYRDFWFDKARGSGHIDPVSGEKGLSQRAMDFRRVVREILDAENSRRGL